jgi:hypothetical protein
MDFLKPLFEEQLTAEISDSGDVAIGNVAFPPARILKQMEPETYDIAFKEWKETRFKDRLEKAEEILNLFDNRAWFSRLQETLERRGSVIPFVGAGMSCPSGFKTWTGYLWALQGHSHVPSNELDALIASGQYDEAAERLLNDLGERFFNEHLHTSFRVFGSISISGAVNYLPLLFDKAVITTNFDDVLERIYTENNHAFGRVLLGRLGESFNNHVAEGAFCLYKLHGDFAEPATRILTRTEYDSAYTDSSPLTETMKQALRSNTFLFLGCSLNEDRTMRLMESLASEVRQLHPHYALLPLSGDDGERRTRQRFLADRNIFPIWYPDGEYDESIEALFVKLLSDMNEL